MDKVIPISELERKKAGLLQQVNLIDLEIKRRRGLFPFNKKKKS